MTHSEADHAADSDKRPHRSMLSSAWRLAIAAERRVSGLRRSAVSAESGRGRCAEHRHAVLVDGWRCAGHLAGSDGNRRVCHPGPPGSPRHSRCSVVDHRWRSHFPRRGPDRPADLRADADAATAFLGRRRPACRCVGRAVVVAGALPDRGGRGGRAGERNTAASGGASGFQPDQPGRNPLVLDSVAGRQGRHDPRAHQ